MWNPGWDAPFHRRARIHDVEREQHRLHAQVAADEHGVVPDRVARGLEQPQALRELDVPRHRLELRAIVIPRLVREARRTRTARGHAPGRAPARARRWGCPKKCLLPPTWSKWRWEFTSVVTADVEKPASSSCAGIVCSGVCSGSSNGSTAVVCSRVEAGVEEEEPVVVLDEHAVRRDPHLRPRHVPHELRVLDDDRAVVEQPDLHRVASSASSALRTATSFAARSARRAVDVLGAES